MNNILVNHFFPYDYFNAVQSKVLHKVYETDENIVVAAPTGAGKTVIAELAMLRLLLNKKNKNRADTKIIYISPIKALCNERYQDWKRKFNLLKFNVEQYTGDTNYSLSVLNQCDIVIVTPEKFDSLTRRWNNNTVLLDSISLIIIDEVHILNESRGACLEGLISRCKMMASLRSQRTHSDTTGRKLKLKSIASLRFIALSATIPNISDISDWLNGVYFKFNIDFRPVPLQHHILSYPPSKNDYLFAQSLNHKIYPLIDKSLKQYMEKS